jgi:hypothetical protein
MLIGLEHEATLLRLEFSRYQIVPHRSPCYSGTYSRCETIETYSPTVDPFPPTGTLTASPSPTAPTPPPPPATKPIYKKWWFWTIIGVVAAGAVAGGVAGGLASQKKPPAEPFLPGDTIYTPTF